MNMVWQWRYAVQPPSVRVQTRVPAPLQVDTGITTGVTPSPKEDGVAVATSVPARTRVPVNLQEVCGQAAGASHRLSAVPLTSVHAQIRVPVKGLVVCGQAAGASHRLSAVLPT